MMFSQKLSLDAEALLYLPQNILSKRNWTYKDDDKEPTTFHVFDDPIDSIKQALDQQPAYN